MAIKKTELYSSLWTSCDEIRGGMDVEIKALQQRFNKTQQIKQGMMQELLTGKTRLLNSNGAR
ncbi:MAG: hypothetical protein KUG82_18860 [Pseudomonadales bacterium]|nr:hypothetical protein [Pseudomonadales bacterium]